MTSRRVTPLLLAASVFLTGATGVLVGSMSPARAITSVDELTDVNQNHWAYEALRDLVEKYDVIEGYPNHTFRGERNATRWELAAALNALIKSVGRDLARLGAEKADRSDLETIAKLQEEFKNELAALQARTDALESRASAIEAKNAEQDQRLTLLERTQLHGDASLGVLADINGQGVRRADSVGSRDGIRDGISAIGRLRLTMDVPVKEDKEDSKIGAGEVHTRLIAAFGRIAPNAVGGSSGGVASSFGGYSRIASDASAANEGINTNTVFGATAGGSNTRANLYVEDLHYHQHFKSGIPLLTDWMVGSAKDDSKWATTGDLYVGSMPWRYLFDKSPYRGNELTQFQSGALVNTAGISVNQAYPMVAYQWHQKLGSDNLSMDLTGSAGSINVGDVMDGFNTTYEGRLNYKVAALPGSLYGGGYNIFSDGNTINENNALFDANGVALTNRSGQNRLPDHKNVSAVYAGWNQEWYKGLGTTFNYLLSSGGNYNYIYNSLNQNLGASNATTTPVNGTTTSVAVGARQSMSGVVNIPMSLFGIRKNDNIGLGYSMLELKNDRIGSTPATSTRYRDGWEKTAEAYYKWAVNDSISIIPSVQWIDNALGVKANGNTWVIGLRTSYTF